MPGISDSTLIRRLQLRNYKSIAACDVSLRSLTFLVGPNGSGKSNFLDSLRFVADALRTSLDHALRDRGGLAEVRRRSGGHPNDFVIRLDFVLANDQQGHYSFRVGARESGGYEVQDEECVIHENVVGSKHSFRVRRGEASGSESPMPPASHDRLYLVNASGLPAFRPVYDALSHMGFYNLNPDRIRSLQPPDAGDLLARDGRNIASVLAQMGKRSPMDKSRIEAYLSRVVPGIQHVETKTLGSMETLEFRQLVAGSKDPWRFSAENMSDGTLRSLGVLVSLFQPTNGSASRVPLVGIEEPEVALHPAAARVLLDSILDASQRSQVIVTSHSPDLLDHKDLPVESILAVIATEGKTQVAPLDEVGKKALQDHLYTAGELLRLNRLQPDPREIEKLKHSQRRLFED